MLMLTRRKRESLVFGDDMYLHVKEILRERIRVRIDVPKGTNVARHNGVREIPINTQDAEIHTSIDLHEDIVIGPVNLCVLRITKSQVRVGVTAPDNMKVMRTEVIEREKAKGNQIGASRKPEPKPKVTYKPKRRALTPEEIEEREHQALLERYGFTPDSRQ